MEIYKLEILYVLTLFNLSVTSNLTKDFGSAYPSGHRAYRENLFEIRRKIWGDERIAFNELRMRHNIIEVCTVRLRGKHESRKT